MKKVILLSVLLLLVGGGCSVPDRAVDPVAPTRDKAPDFALQDYNGNTVSLADFKGRPVVINSWAAWCPFCKSELVDFAEVVREMETEVVVVAINRAEPLVTAKRYSDALDATDNLIFLLDPKDSFYKSIDGFSMPETIFVNAEGYIEFHRRGPMDREEFTRRIKDITK